MRSNSATLSTLAAILGLGISPLPAANLPREAVLEHAIPWLASDADTEPTVVPVLDLDCQSCLARMQAALAEGPALPRFFLDTHDAAERRMAQLLVAAGLSGATPQAQQQRFRDVLQLYLADAAYYLDHPDDFAAVVEAPIGESHEAAALNFLDRHQALLGLLAVEKTPLDLPYPATTFVAPAAESPRDPLIRLRNNRVALQFLQPPPDLVAGAQIARLALESRQSLPREAWQQVARLARQGMAWHWIPEPADFTDSPVGRWQSWLYSLPNDNQRRTAFLTVLDHLAANTPPAGASFANAVTTRPPPPGTPLTTDWQDHWRMMHLNESLTRY